MVGSCCLLAVTVALVACPTAGAFPVAQDLTVARAALPAGHPCKQAVTIQPRLGLPGLAGAPIGVQTPHGWMQRLTDGRLEPLDCIVRVNPDAWARLSACGRRRSLKHEVMHLAGHEHSEGGIMAESPQARARVAVRGCPAARPRHARVLHGPVFDSRGQR
jgi:hypothetical protein